MLILCFKGGDNNNYYRFIVRFPIESDFLFITFRLNFFLSRMSSLSYPANTNVFLTLEQGCGSVIFVLMFRERSYMVLIILVSIIMFQERS